MEILHADLLRIYGAPHAEQNISINIARRSQQENLAEPQRKFPLQNSSEYSLCQALYMHRLSSILQGEWKGKELVP